MQIFLSIVVVALLVAGLALGKTWVLIVGLIYIVAAVIQKLKKSNETDSSDKPADMSVNQIEKTMQTQELKQIPKQVTIAINLILTVILLMIVGGLMDFSHAIATEKDTPYWAHVAGIPIEIAIALFLGYKIYAGRNWARWVYLIYIVPTVSVVFSVGEIFQRSPLLGVVCVAASVLSLAVIFLLFSSPGKLWFRKPRKTVQPENEDSNVEVVGEAHEDSGRTNRPSVPASSPPSEATKSVDLEESWKKIESGVSEPQQSAPSYRTSDDRKTTPDSEVRMKPWMPSTILVAGVVGFLLFFHIVPSHMAIFPKQSPTFADTFVNVEDYLKRFNDANFVAQALMEQTSLHQQLLSRKLIVNIPKGK